MAWHHWIGIGTHEGKTEWLQDRTYRLQGLTEDRIGLLKAKTENKVGLAQAKQEYNAAKKAYRANTFSGKALGKFKGIVGWGALGVLGIGALTWLSSRSRNDRHVDNMPPQPQEIEAAPAIPDFSTGERTVRGPFTARVLGVGGNAAIQPNMMGNDGASLVDGKPVGALGPSPN